LHWPWFTERQDYERLYQTFTTFMAAIGVSHPKLHGNVMLAIEIWAINKIPLLIIKSQDIHFGTTKLIRDKMTKTIMKLSTQVVQAYQSRGFKM